VLVLSIMTESEAGMEGYQERTSVIWLLEATESVVSVHHRPLKLLGSIYVQPLIVPISYCSPIPKFTIARQHRYTTTPTTMSIRQLESGLKQLNVNDENEAPQPTGLKSKVLRLSCSTTGRS